MSNGVTIQGDFPEGHPLADTHRYAFDLGAPVANGESIAFSVSNVRLLEAAQQQKAAAEDLMAAVDHFKEIP